MNGRAHMLMGAAAAAPFLLVTQDAWSLVGYGAVSVAASLAPDIDHPKSSLAIAWPKRVGWALTGSTARGGKRPPSMLVRFVFFTVLYGLMRGLSRGARYASRTARRYTSTPDDRRAWNGTFDPDHRGLTHTGAAALVASVACGWLADVCGGPWLVGAAVFAGWMSHLLSDACTRAGVPLLWPMRRPGWRRVEVASYGTNGRARATSGQYETTSRRWHRVRLMKRWDLASCAATDWRVAWLVVFLTVAPTVSLLALYP